MKYDTQKITPEFVTDLIDELAELSDEVLALPWFLARRKELIKRLRNFEKTGAKNDWLRVRDYVMRYSLKELF